MRWDNKKEPKDGDILVVKKFAFFPTKISTKTVWLEKYEEKYRWGTHTIDVFAGIFVSTEITEWILIEKKLI